MKQMIKDIIDIYNEDRKEFIEGMLGGLLIFIFIIFMLWFVGTFCYDM